MLQPQVGQQQQFELSQQIHNYLHEIILTQHASIFPQEFPSLATLLLQTQQQLHQPSSFISQGYQQLGLAQFPNILAQRTYPCDTLEVQKAQFLSDLKRSSTTFDSQAFQQLPQQGYLPFFGQPLSYKEQLPLENRNQGFYIGEHLKTPSHKPPPLPPPAKGDLELLASQTQLFSLPRQNSQGFRLVQKIKPSTSDAQGLGSSSIERQAKVDSPVDCSWQDSATSKIHNDLDASAFASHDSYTLQIPIQPSEAQPMNIQQSSLPHSSNLNLEYIKEVTDISKLKELGARVFGSESQDRINTPGTSNDSSNSEKKWFPMTEIDSYLHSLDLKIDFNETQNYSLFFHSKFPEREFIHENTLESDGKQGFKKLHIDDTSNRNTDQGIVVEDSLKYQQPQQQGQNQTSNVQSIFVNARRNKKREQKIKESLKSNSKLSTKFHNLTRLLMYKIVKIFMDDKKMTEFYDLSSNLAASLKQIAGKLKQHSKDTCKSTIKTNFYTHSHYNVLFLILNEETIRMLATSPKDLDAHKQILGLDLLNPDPILLSFANLIKSVAFKIVKINLPREIVESEDSVVPTKTTLSHSQNEPDNYIGNLRSVYFERAFQGIVKMNKGCLVNRF